MARNYTHTTPLMQGALDPNKGYNYAYENLLSPIYNSYVPIEDFRVGEEVMYFGERCKIAAKCMDSNGKNKYIVEYSLGWNSYDNTCSIYDGWLDSTKKYNYSDASFFVRINNSYGYIPVGPTSNPPSKPASYIPVAAPVIELVSPYFEDEVLMKDKSGNATRQTKDSKDSIVAEEENKFFETLAANTPSQPPETKSIDLSSTKEELIEEDLIKDNKVVDNYEIY